MARKSAPPPAVSSMPDPPPRGPISQGYQRSSPCRLCISSHRTDIEQALVRGESAKDLAAEYGLSYAVITRHKRQHMADLPRDLSNVLKKIDAGIDAARLPRQGKATTAELLTDAIQSLAENIAALEDLAEVTSSYRVRDSLTKANETMLKFVAYLNTHEGMALYEPERLEAIDLSAERAALAPATRPVNATMIIEAEVVRDLEPLEVEA